MADQEVDIQVVNIRDLIELVTRNPNASIPLYDTESGTVKRILVSTLIAGQSVSIPWLLNVTYNIPDIIEWNSKFWKTKVNGNLGNQPAENELWTEVSASVANGASLSNWSAGLFTVSPCCVVYSNTLYILDENFAPLPFLSENFENERASGTWISGDVDLSNLVKRTGENLPLLPPKTAPFYNWHTTQADICPSGWHVPTVAEMNTLIAFLGGNSVAGGKLKEAGLNSWSSPNTGATDQYGFGLKSQGTRDPVVQVLYMALGELTYLWLNDQYMYAAFAYNSAGVSIFNTSAHPAIGCNIRLIKDNNTPPIGQTLDASGNSYGYVQIGTQIWSDRNLETTKDNLGNIIPNLATGYSWQTALTPALCFYNNIQQPLYKHVIQTENGDVMLVDAENSGSETITIENTAEYSDTVAYNAGNVYVSFKNIASLNPQFQTAKLYRCNENTIAGENPEEFPMDPSTFVGKWEYLGTAAVLPNNTTSLTSLSQYPVSAVLRAITNVADGHTISLYEYNAIVKYHANDTSGIRPNDPLMTGSWIADSRISKKQLLFLSSADIRLVRSPEHGDTAINNATRKVYNFVEGDVNADDDNIYLTSTYPFGSTVGNWVYVTDLGGILASQLEAESNTENTKYLSSLRTFQNWYNNVKNYTITELNTTSKTIVGAINWLKSLVVILKEPTGFRYPELVDVSYNPTTRMVTITGTTEAYYRGELVTQLISGWQSEAHAIGDNAYFLYFDGTNFIWANTAWPFDAVQIAMAYRDGVNFCLRECHGLMAHQTHEHLHETIGTYLKSGGDITNYTLASTTAANRRPQISLTTIKDEDLPTQLSALTTNAYTQLSLSGVNVANTVSDAVDIIALSTNQPYYNQFTGGNWVQTLFTNNAYGKIFVMAIPVTSDVECQKKRFVFIQPQTINTSLPTIQAISASSVNLGHIAGALSEYVFIGEIIVRYAAGNWTLISVAKIVGSKISQAIVQGGGGGGASTAAELAVDATPFNGNLTTADTNVQACLQKFDDLVFTASEITRDATPTLSSTNQELANLELDAKITSAITLVDGAFSAILTFDKPNERLVNLAQSDIVEFTINATNNIAGAMKLIELDAHASYPVYFASNYTVINGSIVQGKRNYIMFFCNSTTTALVSINQGSQFIFDIATMPGLLLYLNSNETSTIIEGTDNTWTDLSPLGGVFSTVGGIRKPDYDPVNKKWIWDGTHQFLKTTTPPSINTSDMTFFAVFNRKSQGDTQLTNGVSGGVNGFYIMLRGTSLYFQIGAGANFNNTYGINEFYNAKCIFRLYPNLSGGIDLYKNGVFVSASTAGFNSTGSIGLIGTSTEASLNKTWNGDIYSIIAFNRKLSASEITKVEQSLNGIFNIY